MAAALEAGLALADLLLWVIWFALLTIIIWIAAAIESALSGLSLPFVGNPFKGVAHAIVKYVSDPVDSLRKDAEKGITKGLNALVTALELFVGLTLLLGLATEKALAYLWNHALVPLARFVANEAIDAALAVKGRITAAIVSGATAVVAAGLRSEGWITAAVLKYARLAIRDALATGGVIEHAIAAVDARLSKAVTAALHSAEGYADTAVSDLRKAEDKALAGAVSALTAGITAAEKATAAAFTQAERDIAAGVTAAERAATAEFAQAERDAAAALAAADATIDTAIAAVKAIAVTLDDDLTTLLGKLSPADAAALIAAIPLIGALVTTIATETGLDNSACRAKVKGICGTNPLQWAGLLAGIAAIGVSFNLADVLKAGLAIYRDAEGLIADIGHITESEVEEIGAAIGQAALAIAA